MKTFIYPYKAASRSVIAIRKAIGEDIKIIKPKGSKYRHGPTKCIINWGSTNDPLYTHRGKGPIINDPDAVALCANKLNFFSQVKKEGQARIPEFTGNILTAQEWAKDGPVMLRTQLNGHSGAGIVFSDEDPKWEQRRCSLYVKYVPKKAEYRVHIWKGDVIDVQQKKLRQEDDQGKPIDKDRVNWRVRNHVNGFIFARNDIDVPQDVTNQAIAAFHSIPGLDFGAFDVIYNRLNDAAYVIECNTAPGLEGTTLDNYVREIKEIIQG